VATATGASVDRRLLGARLCVSRRLHERRPCRPPRPRQRSIVAAVRQHDGTFRTTGHHDRAEYRHLARRRGVVARPVREPDGRRQALPPAV